MTKQSVVEEIRTALEQISRQFAVFTAGNRIPEDDELDMLKGKMIRLYDKINMLQLVEGNSVQPPVQHLPSSGIELMKTESAPVSNVQHENIETGNLTEEKSEDIQPAEEKHETIVADTPSTPEPQISFTPEPEVKIEPIVEQKQEPAKPLVAEVQAVRSGIFKESEPTIAQQFHESETIHDKIGAAQHAFAVADKLKLTPVTDLVKVIGINEKFLFISQLFNNNHQAYQQAIDKLNNSKTFADAYMYFDTEVVSQFHSDKTSDVYKQFIDLLQRRFI
ncbi:MAG TPA: hypothetical protein PKN14_11455 [Bacteroidia bacterium]|nr:hypothetical protein [Bacteroidia bacterium]MBX3107172.1 hypothetical protein [Bacteroidota bacterium]OQB62201.1 MAG: hypothetical protein BWX95_01462 [Bacteroidetes bacterium ADurb.Bin141]MBV6454750.1 hypothetical protein [Bacteroidia bacterium]HNR49850.1 hypothetical protein [Bacteroidia bacterium]